MSKSSELVLNWLNNEIKLKPKIVDIKKSFSNGYHFAEIFYILKLISPEEFCKFTNTEKYSDKKLNFLRIEKICQKLFNLIIPEEDINMIINKDYSKAVVLLYKLRNCIYKNNIHFNDIQIFGNAFSNNEISNQIKEIIRRQFYDDEEEENESAYNSKDSNQVNNSESIYADKDNARKTKYEEEKNIINKNNFKYTLEDDIKEEIEENENISNKFALDNKNKTINKSMFGFKKNLPSIKIKKNENRNNYDQINDIKNKLLLKPKNILAPINHRLIKTKSNSCENIFSEMQKTNDNNLIIFRNTNQSEAFNGTFSTKSFNSKLIDVSHFNKKLEDLGVVSNDYKLDEEVNPSEIGNSTTINIFKNQNMKNTKTDNKSDILHESMYNTKTIEEVRNELRNKIKYKKIDNMIKQKEIKRELSQKNIDDNKCEVNFLRMNKNKFLEKNKSMNLLFKNYSNESLLKRFEYSKELAKKNDKEAYEKKKINLNKFYQSQKDFLPTLFSNQKFYFSRNKPKKIEPSFNSKKYFEKLNKLNYLSNLIKTEKKRKIKNAHCILIKDIVLFIIDMAMEGYFYQNQKKQELMDLKTFLKFNIYFLKNKPLRKKLVILEDNEYKRSSKLEDNIDIEKLVSSLTNEEKNLIQDYIYYLGLWDDEKIFDKNLRGLKLEYKYVNNSTNNANSFNSNYFGLNEYEPTVLENEDLLLPSNNIDNTLIGNTIIDALEHKFTENKIKNAINSNEIKLNIKQNINNKNINKNNSYVDNCSKWDYIPYKIALVGYPLSGRKTVSEKINNKYPNLKIYSTVQIIKDYYELFLKYSDPPEDPHKNKNQKKKDKKNEKDKKSKAKETIFEKQERHKKLREMQPIINLIQPYIDYQQNINNTTSNNNMNKSENSSNKELFIMKDENLCKLLIKKIEEDFPFIDREKINKNSIELQKNIHDMQNKIEEIKKRKLEAKKPNPKDDFNIEKLEKDIKSLKEKSISGFILVDFPTNITQCYLLENYLTGFVEEKRKEKSEKSNIIESISSIIDFKMEPKEKKMNKKSGLNFLIHISAKESIINERFSSLKYDPVEEKVYSNISFISEKKILERLVDEIPSLPKDLFEYYKDEYNNNINKIINLYTHFGFSVNSKTEENEAINSNNNKTEKIIKTYQFIEAEEIRHILPTEEKGKKTKKRAARKSPKKSAKMKEKEKEKNNQTEKNVETTTNSNLNENGNKDKVYDFICGNIIEKLFLEKEKCEKELFYSAYPKYKKKDKNQIYFAPDLNINEIKTKYKNKSPKKQNKDLILIDYDTNKINLMISKLTLINNKYNNHLAKFIHLTSEQKKNIYTRLNLIQTKFRNYLNMKSNKKKIISNYIKKFNHLFNLDPSLLANERVIEELNSDIEDLRSEIWKIINKKQNLSIEELKEIRNCGYIESELLKFYFNIKDLILLETEKFVTILSNIIMLYTKKKEREKEKDKESNINELVAEFQSEIVNKTELMLKNLKPFNYYLNDKKEAKFEQSLDEVTDIIFDNIETLFKNSIKLLFSYNEKIDIILKRIKKIIYNNAISDKKTFKSKRKKRKNSESKVYSLNMVNDLLTNKDTGYFQEESIKKMFLDEKNKYKFRICYIKSFAIKYIHIMKCSAENIFNNMDDWIVKNVTLQNESLSFLIKILRQFLNDKASIDQQNDIDYIELDEFEKVIDDEEVNNNSSHAKAFNNSSNISNFNGSSHEVKLKPFDNSSVLNMNRIYNKINLDYLVNETFLDTKIEEIPDNKTTIIKKKKRSNFKIIPSPRGPPGTESNIRKNSSSNDDLNTSSGILKKQYMLTGLTDADFYFDIEKFKFIYKLVKKYEIEDGLINKEIFFQIFIKQFLFNKRKNAHQSMPKQDEENDQEKNNINNINNFYQDEMNVESKNINSNMYPGICPALKSLRSKQIQRLLNIFIINIEKINYISFENEVNIKDKINISEESEQSKDKKEKEKEKKEKESLKRKDNKKPTNVRNKKIDSKEKNIKKNNADESKDKDKNKKTEKNEVKEIKEEKNVDNKNKKEEKEKEKNNIEYETFLGTKEIFTILSLIGVNVLTNEMEEKIDNELKDKYIMNKYLTKSHFLEYKFWFEAFFEFLNEKGEKGDEIKGMQNIKEFLFDIWKNDDNSVYFDFKKFLEVLKVNKYVTDCADFNDIRYYDIIFEQ